ncbi:hypothetical protein ACHAW5_010931 [Stephanodiscus triporus]|uniref:Uncharacterized protein n=1 Tax=Stephanodiscus triporus TaxID=2934178 RepID=A0ABD3QZS2_9STRA
MTTSGLSSVYGATALASTKHEQRKNGRRDAPSREMASAMDAAVAMNSIEFISHLTSYKDTTNIKTYTQTTPSSCENTHSTSKNNDSSRGISSWIVGSMKSSGCNVSNKSAETKSMDYDHPFSNPCTTHATVIEYVAQLWFLPVKREGVRFRETIRVLSISADGRSSTVECTAQYHNGSRWIDCSRVICNFTSVPFVSVENNVRRHRNKDQRASVKMSLDGELLVWLPLPKAASKAVGKKIISTFKTAALDFFHELDSH